MLKRKVTYRLYPNKNQADALVQMQRIHQRVYNAALEERIRVYSEEKRSLSYVYRQTLAKFLRLKIYAKKANL